MVEPLDFLDEKILLGFLHINKTELSLMENPQTFVTQLRDYNLISEERYKKINRLKSKERIRSALYNALDWIENQKPELIHRFWRCAFKETIVNKYPTLRLLRNSLYDGSYESESALLEGVSNEDEDDCNRKETSKEEALEEKKDKKRKRTTRRVCEEDKDEEQAGPSTQVTSHSRKKPKKISFSSPLKKGEKGDIWTWDIFKGQLPVTCGDQKGTLNRDRLAKGKNCILVDKQWHTPSQFERLGGKASYKNWKLSIRCMDTPLGKLIQEGHLKSMRYSKRPKVKKSLFPSEITTTESEDTEEKDSNSSTNGGSSSDSTEEQQRDIEEQNQIQSAAKDGRNRVLKVMCEDIHGLLHTKRFASGTCGKSIRADTGWMTPVEFVKEASCQTDVSWKLHIKCEGEPLGDLIKAKKLAIHSLLCTCSLCVPDSEDLDDEKNDDECWTCRTDDTEEKLVECDNCPRSFHQKCHLPHVEDALLDDGRPWMCTLCVFRRNKALYAELTMEAAMASATSGHMLQCQYLLLSLYRADEERVFTADPCPIIRDYTRVIRKPMWFDCIADKLQEKQYQTVGEFVSDVQLIFTNCSSFNRDNPDISAIGIKMKDFFEIELNSAFQIQELVS